MTRWQRLRSQVYLTLSQVTRGMTLGVRVMLIDGDRVLLIRHTYVPGWQFPGGGIEPRETAEDSARREVLEETGYRVRGRLELFGFYYNGQVHPRDHVALYLCREHEVAVPFSPSLEIAELGWFAAEDLPQETTRGTRRRAAEVFGGQPPSSRW